jgi:hypothetical protein
MGKYNKTKFTQYVYQDLYYEYYNNDQTTKVKTYQKKAINFEPEEKFEKLTFQKNNIPYFHFPSTKRINDIIYVEKLSICFHHNVYLNFETRVTQDMNNNATSHDIVYININLDNKVDELIINSALQKILSIFN